MKNFNFSFPTAIKFGVGRSKEIGETTAQHGKTAFVVMDPFLKGSKTAAEILEDLHANGVKTVEYYEVVPNPRNTSIDAGAALCVEKKCDVVVVIGGGSAIDTAKAIALVAKHGGNCWEYTERQNEEVKRPATPGLPIIVSPTTAGTGSEATCGAVINNPSLKRKCTIINHVIYPTVSIIDPELMVSVPAQITALTGIDTFAHAFEAYICANATAISDMLALSSIEFFAGSIRQAVKNGSDLEARSKMAMACSLGGAAIFNAGVCLPHAIGQPLSAYTDAPHGGTLAACIPQVIEWTIPCAQDRFAKVASILDPKATAGLSEKDSAAKLPAIMKQLYNDLGVDVSFSGYGLKKADLNDFVDLCFTAFKQDIDIHPKKCSRADVLEVVEMCM